MYFDCIQPPPSQIHSLFPTHSTLCLRKRNYQEWFVWPIYSWMCGLHWSRINPPEAESLKLPLAATVNSSLANAGLCFHLLPITWGFRLAYTSQIVCTLSQPLWINMCPCPARLQNQLSCSYPQTLTIFLIARIHNDPWAFGVGDVIWCSIWCWVFFSEEMQMFPRVSNL